jgi:hypothetical protein
MNAFAGGRSTTSYTLAGLTITIPAKRQPVGVVFFAVWLPAWLAGGMAALWQVFANGGPEALFLIVWLCGWGVGVYWATYSFLWCAVGKEVVSLASSTLSIKYDVFGVGRTLNYSVYGIRHLRVLPQSRKAVAPTTPFLPLGSGIGAVAFDYGTEVVRFAAVGELEAKEIVSELTARHPFAEGAA